MGVCKRWISVAVLALCVVVGCVKLRQEADLYPDGSGRIWFRATGEIGRALQDPALTDQSVYEHAVSSSRGLVAITDAKLTQTEERQTTEFVGWFEDANDVQLGIDDSALLAFDWKRRGDRYVLRVESGFVRELAERAVDLDERLRKIDESVRDATPETREQAEAMAEMSRALMESTWKAMTEELELETIIRLPGRIQSIEGFEKVDARTVRIHLDAETMEDLARMREFKTAEFVVECDGSILGKEDQEAFARQLAKAKEQWSENPAARTVAADEVAVIGEDESDGRPYLLGGGERLVILDAERLRGPTRLFANSGKELAKLEVGRLDYDGAITSPDGKRLHVVFPVDHQVVTYDLATGKPLWQLQGPADSPGDWRMGVAPDGKLYVDRRSEGTHLHDGETGAHLRTVLPNDAMWLLTVSHDPSHVVMSHDEVFRVLDTEEETQLWYQPATIDGKVRIDGKPVGAWFAHRADGDKLLLVSVADTRVEVTAHEAETGKLLWRISSDSAYIHCHPNHRYALFEARTGSARVFDLRTGTDLGRVTGLPDQARVLGMDATGGLWVAPGDTSLPRARKYRLRVK